MSRYPRQPSSRGPAPVTVHDDCHMQSFIAFTFHCKNSSQKRPLYAVSFGTNGVACHSADPGTGTELNQSMLRVKYMAAATATKLAMAPTSNASSSSRSNV